MGSNGNKGHARGRIVQGFSDSHHKDETGRTEQFFDAENDQAQKFHADGQAGNFGVREQENFNGLQQDAQAQLNQARQQNELDNQQYVDNKNANGAHFDAKRYGAASAAGGSSNGGGEQLSLRFNENRQFSKQQPVLI